MAELEEPLLPSDSDSDSESDDNSVHSSMSFQEIPDPAFEEAMAYLLSVKQAFADNIRNYNEFLNVLKEYRENRANGIPSIISKVKFLFKEHPRLLVGIKTFLPDRYKNCMPLDSNSDSRTPEYQDLMEFVKNLKDQFPNDIRVYSSLFDILIGDYNQKRSIEEVHQEVSNIFHDEPKFLEDFELFFPLPSKTSSDEIHEERSTKGKKSFNLSYMAPCPGCLLAFSLTVFGMMISFIFYRSEN